MDDKKFTHYSYVVQQNHWREPKGLFDFSARSPEFIREEAERLQSENGLLLAPIPLDSTVQDMAALRALLAWCFRNPHRVRAPRGKWSATDDGGWTWKEQT